RARVPAPLRAAVRRSVDRLRPVAAGLPRLDPGPLLPAALLLLQVLLRRLAALPQRARRGHLRWHDGANPAGGARRTRRLGRMVHHRGRRTLPAVAPGWMVRAASRPVLRLRDHAADLRRAKRAAVSVGLWGVSDADVD